MTVHCLTVLALSDVFRRHVRSHALWALAVLLVAMPASGQTLYWDLNGTSSGASSTPTGTWSAASTNWNSSFFGTSATAAWTSGASAVFSAGFDATNNYTVTVSGTQNVSGLTVSMGGPTFSGGTISFIDTTPDVWTFGGATATINSVIAGTNGLTKTGGGTLVLGGSAKTYSGTTTVSNGTLRVDASNIINNASALTVASGATFELNWNVDETVGALAGAGTVNIRDNTLTVGDSTNSTFSGKIEDGGSYGSLIKQGSGTLTLSGASTYSGPTTINTGVVVAANNAALGAATNGNTIASGAALHLQGSITLGESQFTVTGSGSGGTGAIRNLSGDNTLSAALDLGGNATIASDSGTFTATGQVNLGAGNTLTVAGNGNTTLSGALTNSSSLTKTGTGTLTLGGTSANSFGGALNVNDGTVLLNKTAGTNAVNGSAINVGDGSGAASSAVLRLGAANQIANYAGTLTVAADGIFQLNNFSESINTIAGTGRIDLGTAGDLTVGSNSGNSTFSGSLLGTGTFTKAGSGLLEIATDLAFGGTFNLAGGTLRLNDITLNLATLNITGNSTIDFAGADASLFVSTLTISAGVTLNITNWSNATDYFFVSNWTGAVADSRNAAPMNQVSFNGLSASSTQWQSYDDQITPVPEPSTYGVILLAAMTVFGFWRRHQATRIR